MIWIREPGNVIILVAVFSALFAQSDISPVKSENQSPLPDVSQIVDSSIKTTVRHWQARLRYTYLEREENRRRDPAGRVKSEDVGVSRTILVNGVPFEQLVERNGRPPSAEEERSTADRRMLSRRRRALATVPKASMAICSPRSRVGSGSTNKTSRGSKLMGR